MRRLTTFLGTLATVALVGSGARANTESVIAYDARSAGMAHTGVATITNAAAMLHNPANLTEIRRLDVTLSLAPDFTNVKTPYLGATSTPLTPAYATSTLVFTPMGFVGVGYKLHPGVAVGLAAQVSMIKGVEFDNTPASILGQQSLAALSGKETALQLFWEARAPIAVDVTRWLTLSGGYRMGFYHQALKATSQSLPAPLVSQSYSGQNYAGAQAGIAIKPSHNVRIGLNYRSKMVLLGSGSTQQLNPLTGASQQGQVAKGATRYISPHMFSAGFGLKFLQHRLTIAGDFKYWMYKDAYAGVAPYRDAMSGHLGAEYFVTPRVPVRAGYLIGLSATRKRQASPFDTTPGLQHGGTLGSGYHWAALDLDAAVGYGASSTEVATSTTALGGRYRLNALLINLSATVHL